MNLVGDVLDDLGVAVPLTMADIAGDEVPRQRPQGEVAQPPQRDRERRAQKLRSWGAPEMAVRLLLGGGFDRTEAVGAAEKLVHDANAGAVWSVLAGPVGAGKTTAAALWLDRVHGRGGARAFVASEIIAALPGNTVHRAERIEQLVKAAALVIDDLARNDVVSGAVDANVQAVLRLRYDARRPTLMTTNQDENTVISLLGGELMQSRWGEVGAYAQVGQVVRPQRRVR